MRIAIYGTDGEKLEEHKQRLHKNIVGIGDTVEIICCQDEEELKAHLKDYQIVFMEETALDKLEQYLKNNPNRRKVTLSFGKENGTFFVDDVYYVEADLSQIHLVTKEGEFLLSISISQAQEVLEKEGFVKVHRSYLVNSNHVVRIKHRTAFMDNGKEIPISKYRLKEVKERLIVSDAGQ